jgi:hypothetical protein
MSVKDLPHFTISAAGLADWLEQQGIDIWWSVDGDPVLTSRISFPCPADELAAELRKLNRPLIVEDHRTPPQGQGQTITATDLDPLVLHFSGHNGTPANDRLLYLRWQGSDTEWILLEDFETTRETREEAASLGLKGN